MDDFSSMLDATFFCLGFVSGVGGGVIVLIALVSCNRSGQSGQALFKSPFMVLRILFGFIYKFLLGGLFLLLVMF